MDMSKYKSLFLSDTGDHLNDLETELVKVEQDPGDFEGIHEIFRHLHSIKGMSSSMGYDEMSRLAHRLEDLMSLHREKKRAVEAEEIDVLLKALDEFRRQLSAIEEDSPLEEVPADLLLAIERYIRKQKAPELRPEAGDSTKRDGAVIEESQPDVFSIEVVISEECTTPPLRAFLIYKRLEEVGQVVDAIPSLEEMRSGRMDGRVITFRLRTKSALNELKRLPDSWTDVEEHKIEPETKALQLKFEESKASSKTLDSTKGTKLDLAEGPTEPSPLSKEIAEGDTSSASQAARSKHTVVRVRTELLDFFVDSVGELITLRSYLEDLSERLDIPALRDGVVRLNKIVRGLHDRVMEVRMVSVSQLTKRLPRVCRDVARSRGKQVKLEVEGDDVELDRALVDMLDTPVLHLLRNAVDHGIEPPEERLAVGKQPEGKIKLSIQRNQDRVILKLADDGRGIDSNKVLSHAKSRGLVTEENEARFVSNPVDLIFQPGFSTGEGVTEISGRGVGLDAVKKTLQGLGGRVSVQSEIGRGTVFYLDLPLTLAILHVLLVEAREHLLAIPASRILRAFVVNQEQVDRSNGRATIKVDGDSLPIVDLLSLLEGKKRQEDAGLEVEEAVLVGDDENPLLALGVGRITGHREVVLKSLGFILSSVGPFGGSSVLGDGRPVLVLDVDGVIQRFTD
jgi:two-component system chemotaxis sensor kinase CheA